MIQIDRFLYYPIALLFPLFVVVHIHDEEIGIQNFSGRFWWLHSESEIYLCRGLIYRTRLQVMRNDLQLQKNSFALVLLPLIYWDSIQVCL